MPTAALVAFREHGEVRRSLDENIDLAKPQLKQLAGIGVDLGQVTHELEVEGVESFTKSFESLLETLTNAAKDIKAGRGPRQWHSLGQLQPAVDTQLASLKKNDAAPRLWAKDPTVWTADPANPSETRDLTLCPAAPS